MSNERTGYTNTHNASRNDGKCQEASLQHYINSWFCLFFSDECGVKVRKLDWTSDNFLTGHCLDVNSFECSYSKHTECHCPFIDHVHVSKILYILVMTGVYKLYQIYQRSTALLFCYESKQTCVYFHLTLLDAESEFGWSEDEILDLHDNTTVIIAADGELLSHFISDKDF